MHITMEHHNKSNATICLLKCTFLSKHHNWSLLITRVGNVYINGKENAFQKNFQFQNREIANKSIRVN